MTVVAFGSVKGAPGVTTLACLVAAAWPPDRAVMVVECDASGGDWRRAFAWRRGSAGPRWWLRRVELRKPCPSHRIFSRSQGVWTSWSVPVSCPQYKQSQSWLRPCYGLTHLRGHPGMYWLTWVGFLSEMERGGMAGSGRFCCPVCWRRWRITGADARSGPRRPVAVEPPSRFGGRWRPGLHEGRDGALHHCSRARRDPV